jgi:AraC family transcriptional regulator
MTMPGRGAPVSLGSPAERSVRTRSFHTHAIQFPEHLSLPRHYHDEATLVVVLGGGFERISNGRRYPCTPGTVFSEPAGEPHSNVFGRSGAAVLIVQPGDVDGCFSRLELTPFVEPCFLRQPGITRMAAQLVSEIDVPDALTGLAVDGLVLQMLALAGRGGKALRMTQRPAWLGRALEIIHEESGRRLSLREMSDILGLHPAYLARAFRQRVGVSLANYARSVRLAAAADALASSHTPIVEIAMNAGFADQSHFTRAFRAYRGATPARYRETARRGRRDSGCSTGSTGHHPHGQPRDGM